ncbi:MAG: cyclic nucleotide-binding domain-containing protein, partial [Elusimicrobiales bacterium]|nr:cyclic nucleotide-binding domain-containing protein [Elusimicrobiales bacterium]
KKIEITDADFREFMRIARKIHFFEQMTVGLLEKILAFGMLYECKKGEKVCCQGDEGDSFYIIHSGNLSVNVKKGFLSFSKKIAILGPGDFFGEMAIVDRSPRVATVKCEKDSKLFILLANHFDEALKESPAFADDIKRTIARRKFGLKQQG